jgi:hypothetical protein
VRRFAAGLRVILQGAVPDLDRVDSTEGERLAWLAGECAGDSALLQEVSSLLDARAQMAGSAAAPSIPLPSASFGTYRAITLENVECLAHGLREILTRCLGRKCVIEQVDRHTRSVFANAGCRDARGGESTFDQVARVCLVQETMLSERIGYPHHWRDILSESFIIQAE